MCHKQLFDSALASVIPIVQTFFDKVLVVREDQAIRQTRQALLQRIWHLADGIVDLTKVEGSSRGIIAPWSLSNRLS